MAKSAQSSFEDRLVRLVARHQEISAALASETPLANDELAKLSKEYSDLSPVVDAIEHLSNERSEAQDLSELIADPETDADMRALAEEEFEEIGRAHV